MKKFNLIEGITFLLLSLAVIFIIIEFNDNITLSIIFLISITLYLTSIFLIKRRNKRLENRKINYEVFPYILISVNTLLKLIFINFNFVIHREIIFFEFIYFTIYLLSIYMFSPDEKEQPREYENYFRQVIISKLERILFAGVSDELIYEVLGILNFFKNNKNINYNEFNQEITLLSFLISEGEDELRIMDQVKKTKNLIKEKTLK